MLKLWSLGLCVCVFVDLGFSTVGPSTFPAPTNVSVTCRNFTNVLYWNYSEPDQQPEFIITIKSYEGEPTSVLTNQTYLDISEYTQNAEDEYLITVEAKGSEVIGSYESVTFSYNEDRSPVFTCVVDFPVLNVSVFPHKISLSFSHPYLVHGDESLKEVFYYRVFSNKTQVLEDECYVDDGVCTADFNLFETLHESCINVHIKGSVSGDVSSIPTEIYRKVCGNGAKRTDWTVLATVLLCSVLGLLFFIVLGVMVFKHLTQPDSQSTILSKLLGMMGSDRVVQVPEQPVLSKVTSVGHTPLLDPPISDPFSPMYDENSSIPTHFPTHFCTDVLISEEEDPGEVTEDVDSGGLNSSNSFSGYDCQKFPIDMGQGDIVEAYGPR